MKYSATDIILFALLVIALTCGALADRNGCERCSGPAVYYTARKDSTIEASMDDGKIGIVDSNKNMKVLFTSPIRDNYRGIDVDRTLRKVYWSQVDQGKGIFRSDLDGENSETVVNTAIEFPAAIAIDRKNRFIYWGDATLQTISRIDMIGTPASRQIIIASTPFHDGLVVDRANSKIYWSTAVTQSTGAIWSANLDGSSPQELFSRPDPFKPSRLALDQNGWIYWTDYVTDTVSRAKLSDMANTYEVLYTATGNLNPGGITIRDNHVYWGQDTAVSDAQGALMRMKRNGDNQRVIRSDVGSIVDLANGPCP